MSASSMADPSHPIHWLLWTLLFRQHVLQSSNERKWLLWLQQFVVLADRESAELRRGLIQPESPPVGKAPPPPTTRPHRLPPLHRASQQPTATVSTVLTVGRSSRFPSLRTTITASTFALPLLLCYELYLIAVSFLTNTWCCSKYCTLSMFTCFDIDVEAEVKLVADTTIA